MISMLGIVKLSISSCEPYFQTVHIKMELQKRQFGLVIKDPSMEVQDAADSLKPLCAYILLRKMNGRIFGFCQAARTIRLRQVANLFSCPVEFWHSGHNLETQSKVLEFLRFLKAGGFHEIGVHKGSGKCLSPLKAFLQAPTTCNWRGLLRDDCESSTLVDTELAATVSAKLARADTATLHWIVASDFPCVAATLKRVCDVFVAGRCVSKEKIRQEYNGQPVILWDRALDLAILSDFASVRAINVSPTFPDKIGPFKTLVVLVSTVCAPRKAEQYASEKLEAKFASCLKQCEVNPRTGVACYKQLMPETYCSDDHLSVFGHIADATCTKYLQALNKN